MSLFFQQRQAESNGEPETDGERIEWPDILELKATF